MLLNKREYEAPHHLLLHACDMSTAKHFFLCFSLVLNDMPCTGRNGFCTWRVLLWRAPKVFIKAEFVQRAARNRALLFLVSLVPPMIQFALPAGVNTLRCIICQKIGVHVGQQLAAPSLQISPKTGWLANATAHQQRLSCSRQAGWK